MYFLAAGIMSVTGGSGCDVVIPAPSGSVMQGIHSGGIPVANCHAGTCTQWDINADISRDIWCTELLHRIAPYQPGVWTLHVSTSTKGNPAKAFGNTKQANDPMQSHRQMASKTSLTDDQADTDTHIHTHTHRVRLRILY